MGKFKEYVSYVLTGLIHIGAGVIVYILTSNILLSVATIFLVMLALDVSMVECKDVITDVFNEFKNTKNKTSKKRYQKCKKNFENLKYALNPLSDYTTASIITTCEKVLNFIKVNIESEKVDNLINVFTQGIPPVITAIEKYLKLKEADIHSDYEEEFNKLLDDFKEYITTEYDNSVSDMKNNFSSCINNVKSSISNNKDSEDK